MENFRKTDLLYGYTWTAEKEFMNKRMIGFSDYYLLYRTEGFEVLPFIIRYMKARGLETLKTFHKIEKMIREELPRLVNGHSAIKTWLENNVHC